MNFTNYTQFYRDRDGQGIEYAARHTRELGFDGVEYFTRSFSDLWRTAAEERRVLDEYGLPVSCYSVSVQLFCDDPRTVEEQMARQLEAAATLGSPYVHHTLFPPYSMKGVSASYDEVFAGVIDSAERIAKRCEALGMVCLYEPQGVYFNGIDGLGRIFGELKERGCRVGICGDFGNSFFVDVDPKDIFDRFAAEIRHVHVKDYRLTDVIDPDKRTYESLSGTYLYDTEVGTGAVDFAHGFRALQKVGYDGAVSFEIEGSDEQLKEALALIKRIIKY